MAVIGSVNRTGCPPSLVLAVTMSDIYCPTCARRCRDGPWSLKMHGLSKPDCLTPGFVNQTFWDDDDRQEFQDAIDWAAASAKGKGKGGVVLQDAPSSSTTVDVNAEILAALDGLTSVMHTMVDVMQEVKGNGKGLLSAIGDLKGIGKGIVSAVAELGKGWQGWSICAYNSHWCSSIPLPQWSWQGQVQGQGWWNSPLSGCCSLPGVQTLYQ
jgi:hypothetical protein